MFVPLSPERAEPRKFLARRGLRNAFPVERFLEPARFRIIFIRTPFFPGFWPPFAMHQECLMKWPALLSWLALGYPHHQVSHHARSSDAPTTVPTPATAPHHRRPRYLPPYARLAPARPGRDVPRCGRDARCQSAHGSSLGRLVPGRSRRRFLDPSLQHGPPLGVGRGRPSYPPRHAPPGATALRLSGHGMDGLVAPNPL